MMGRENRKNHARDQSAHSTLKSRSVLRDRKSSTMTTTILSTTLASSATDVITETAAVDALWKPSESKKKKKKKKKMKKKKKGFDGLMYSVQLSSDGTCSTIGSNSIGLVVGTRIGSAICRLVASKEYTHGVDALGHCRCRRCFGLVWHCVFNHICTFSQWHWRKLGSLCCFVE
jgi:hypothetical protein